MWLRVDVSATATATDQQERCAERQATHRGKAPNETLRAVVVANTTLFLVVLDGLAVHQAKEPVYGAGRVRRTAREAAARGVRLNWWTGGKQLTQQFVPGVFCSLASPEKTRRTQLCNSATNTRKTLRYCAGRRWPGSAPTWANHHGQSPWTITMDNQA